MKKGGEMEKNSPKCPTVMWEGSRIASSSGLKKDRY